MRELKFDAVVIGSGIGGLTCANYLARSGMKVAVFEQHYKAGGYCGSFKRGPFTFDVGPHDIRGLGTYPVLKNILKETGIDKRVKFLRHDPSDEIIFPGYSFTLGSDIRKTQDQLKRIFKKEAANLDKFFKFVDNFNAMQFASELRKKTFVEFLDMYFTSIELKKALYALVASTATTPYRVSAIAAVLYYKLWVYDSGYYPKGGMQSFSDAFVDNLKDFGGKIYFSSLVKKILISNNKVRGVLLKDGTRIGARFVISNADARQTFLGLVGENNLPQSFILHLSRLKQTFSTFFVMLGLNKKLHRLGMTHRLWHMHTIKDNYISGRGYFKNHDYVVLFSSSLYDPSLASSDGDNLYIMKFVDFKSDGYWNRNKFIKADEYIKEAEEMLPGLSGHISCQVIATPQSFYRYTLNYKGAAGGWAWLPSQVGNPVLDLKTPVGNLFLAGHWTKPGVGVFNVASSGAFVAKTILRFVSRGQ